MRSALRLLPLLAVAIIVAWGAPALAFHDDGVAHCNGCHTMHNSYEGQLIDTAAPNGNPWLLRDASPSDVCLRCHSGEDSSRGVFDGSCSTGHSREKGGGNYIYLLCADLRETTRSSAPVIPGDRAGHNLYAPGFGLDVDDTLTQAPGGDFPASEMGCTSCHDPHGTSAFRLLYENRLVQGFYNFNNPAPVAVGTRGPEDFDDHTAYQSGMSEWCGNCHTNFDDIGTTHKHVTGADDGALGAEISRAYNLYNGSDDLIGGAAGTAYWPEVPFEDPANTVSSTAGPSASSVVMCLTCHRAHATSAQSAGRWDFNVTFIEEDGLAHTTYPLSQRIAALSTNANRSLCNKCHVKDVDDAIYLDSEF